MEKILILGSNGFLGKHLTKILLDNGFSVYGIDISKKNNVDGLTFFQGDLLDNLFITLLEQ